MVSACFWPQLPVIISTRTELCVSVKRYFYVLLFLISLNIIYNYEGLIVMKV